MKRKKTEEQSKNEILKYLGGAKTPKISNYSKPSTSKNTTNFAPKRNVFKDTKFNSFSSAPKYKKKEDSDEEPDFSSFSEDQQSVLKAAYEGQNIFFTGCAGTGKSYILRELVKNLKKKYTSDSIAIVAPTGIAGKQSKFLFSSALNIGGTTLHSFAGIGLGNLDKEKLLKNVLQNKFNTKRWRNTGNWKWN
jgi:ATP-dependent DNA helicase PIF1